MVVGELNCNCKLNRLMGACFSDPRATQQHSITVSQEAVTYMHIKENLEDNEFIYLFFRECFSLREGWVPRQELLPPPPSQAFPPHLSPLLSQKALWSLRTLGAAPHTAISSAGVSPIKAKSDVTF